MIFRRKQTAPDDDVLVEFVVKLAHPGFRTREEVHTLALEFAEDEGINPAAVSAVVQRVWEARLAEQRSWPAFTDADRVAAAFAELETRGIVARMNFTCCQTCALAEITHEASNESLGYVYFHGQDAERLAEPEACLFLGYGPFGATDAESHEARMLEVGSRARSSLERQGLQVSWNGSTEKRIAVTGLQWRRRLPV
jgi:hypothetical protein